MTIADAVYEQVKALPEPLAREVLDFVAFLRERRDREDWRDLMDAQARSLAPVWDNSCMRSGGTATSTTAVATRASCSPARSSPGATPR